MGGWGERPGMPPLCPCSTPGEGLEMPVVRSTTWAARQALTHCAPFPLQDCGDGSEGWPGLLLRLSQRQLCRLASWGQGPGVLAWTQLCQRAGAGQHPGVALSPPLLCSRRGGSGLQGETLLGNGVIGGSLPPPGSGLCGVLCQAGPCTREPGQTLALAGTRMSLCSCVAARPAQLSLTLSVLQLTPGGKAAQAGVGVGDWVLYIDGESTSSMTHIEAQNRIRACGDRLCLTLSR